MTAEDARVLEQPSLRDLVVTSLRTRILARELAVGQRLDVAELARAYHISQGPVREALIVLEAEGVVRSRARRGVYVSEISTIDLVEIYQAREAVEVMCVRLLLAAPSGSVRPNPLAAVDELTSILSRIEAEWDSHDWAAAVAADMDFHCSIAAHSGNGRLARIARTLADQTLMHLGQVVAAEKDLLLRPTAVYHEQIVRTLSEGARTGQSADAQAAVQSHYDWSRRRLTDPTLGLAAKP